MSCDNAMSVDLPRFEHHNKFPGLVRPYSNNASNSENSQPQQAPINFSIYDDDNARDHFLLVPGCPQRMRSMDVIKDIEPRPKLSVKDRTTTFPPCARRNMMHGNSSRHVISSREQRTLTSKFLNPPTHPRDHNIIANKLLEAHEPDEYCTLSTDAKTDPQASTFKSCPTPLASRNRENFRNFSAKFVSSNAEGEAFESHVELELNRCDSEREICRTPHRTSRLIDLCTCMFCVKSVNYQLNYDPDAEIEPDPCGCSGPVKKVAGRWLCMGFLALFLPCLFCYWPVQMCRKATCKSCSRSKLKDGSQRHEHYYVTRDGRTRSSSESQHTTQLL